MTEQSNTVIVADARQARAHERQAADVRAALRELCAAVADLLRAVDAQEAAQAQEVKSHDQRS